MREAREAETGRLRREYERDIDILRLASELVVDDIVEPEDLRDELIRRFAAARGKDRRPLAAATASAPPIPGPGHDREAFTRRVKAS